MQSRTVVTFFAAMSHCWLTPSLLSTKMPRDLFHRHYCSDKYPQPYVLYMFLTFSYPNATALRLSLLKCILFALAQFSVLPVSMVLATPCSLETFADLMSNPSTPSSKTFVTTLKNSGLKTKALKHPTHHFTFGRQWIIDKYSLSMVCQPTRDPPNSSIT